MKLLIDGDIILYNVGFYNDKIYYKIGNGGTTDYKYKKEANAECDRLGIPRDQIVKCVTTSDLQKNLDGIDWMLSEIQRNTGHEEWEVFITGGGNYRYDTAVTVPYKGNRKDSAKPSNFSAMRDYMLEEVGASLIEGKEADDALGIAQCSAEPETTIICSLDKDLLMIPGLHYNWRKDEHKRVTPEEGFKHFCKQMLTGDTADNIQGIKKVGEKTAESLLAPYGMDDRLLFTGVTNAYKREFRDDWRGRLDENADLLWIQREEDVRFNTEDWL